jgi:multidrug efflux pump subunit AcrB
MAVLVVAGITAYRTLPLEAQPEVKIPVMMVHTLYPGVAPEDVEKLVTNVLERELKDLKDVKKMTSTSSESVSLVTVEFESGVELDNAYQKMRDRITRAKPDLPDDAEEPTLIEINLSEFPMMLINVSGDYGLQRLKQAAEGLEEKIEQIPGVLGADLVGGLDREIQVYLDPARMEHHQIGVGQVIDRIRQEHRTTPAGSLELGRSKYAVRIPGEYRDVRRMEQIVVKSPGGHPVKLEDLGRVVDGFKERETISRINGDPCVTLRVKKRAGENIVAIADQIRALLNEQQPLLPAGTALTVRQDQSTFVKNQVSDLENNIITGLLLVVVVLLFSMGVRNALFVAIAIPLSMLISFAVLQALGITLNMVVLFSLILALGMIVDNSIVVVENIFRHVGQGTPRGKAALLATREVAWPIIASTATTVTVFAPLLFWPGIMGEFMKYLPITVIVVLSSSLFVALVINPVLASSLMRVREQRLVDDSGQARGWVLGRYQRALRWALGHPRLTIGLAVLALGGVVGIYGVAGAGVELFPVTTPERGQVLIKAPQGTRLSHTDDIMRRVERTASAADNTRDTVANVGFGGGGGLLGGGQSTNLAVADLEFLDRRERTHSTWDTITEIREGLSDVAGAEVRVEVEKEGPPTGPPVAVEISGPDYSVLSRHARQVRRWLARVPGVVDIKDDFEGGKPEVRVQIDREQAMLRKVNTASISMAVRTAINGTEASVLREGDEEYDIVVRYDRDFRRSIADILEIKVTGKDDVQIPLRDVARVTTTAGLGSINHIDQKRTLLVSADVIGRSSTEVMQDVRALLGERLRLPSGYSVSYSGESETQEESSAFLGRAFGLGVMLMLLILVTQFNSLMRPAIILSSVVMSLVGVLVGLVLTQDKFGIIMTGTGVISLAGVVVNNAIVLIDYTDQLRRKLGLPLKEALLQAGVVRFRPVLLTAITTVLGLLPMALGVSIDFRSLSIDTNSPSMEWWGPMAQAVSFGLVFATILTLIVVPVMYLLQERSKAWALRQLRRLRPARPQPT